MTANMKENTDAKILTVFIQISNTQCFIDSYNF